MKKLLVLFLLATTLCVAQDSQYKKLTDFFNLLEENDKAMGSISILQEGNLVYTNSIGYQYKTENNKELASKNTKYRIGSITKMFTATIIFQLVDEGKIELTDLLSEYFPKVPNASKITIANLLNHSSGLFNLTNSEDFGEWMENPTNTKEMLSRIYATKVLFEPEERNEYSNTNYLILGYILEQIDGATYASILNKRIIKKLALKNTNYGTKIDINNNESQSYLYLNESWTQSATETHMSVPGGAGAIVSTSSDLVVFIDALFSGKLLSDTSFASMTSAKGDFGSGIFKMEVEGNIIFGHEGGIDGFQSMLIYIPAQKTAIALTLNAINYGLKPIMLNAVSASLNADFDLPAFTRIDITVEEIKKYAGVYSSDETFFNLVFEANGTILKGAPEGSNLKELVPTKKNQFTFDTLQIVLDFDPEAGTVIFTKGEDAPILFYKQ